MSTAKEIVEAGAIETTSKELLKYYLQEEVDSWWNTPIIGPQTPLELVQDGRARFLIPFVRGMIDARKDD